MKAQRSFSISIELNEVEATILCALVGGVVTSSRSQTPARALVDSLFDALDAALPDREGSFSDFFTGSVAVKS